jgi:hypothetical protein
VPSRSSGRNDEVDAVVQPLVAEGELRFDPLWSLPPAADALGADGRVTAGHFAVLRVLREEGRLEQLILIDRGGPAEPDEREQEMTSRLLSERRPERTTLVVVGAYHALLERVEELEPLGVRVRRELPGLDAVQVLFDHGEVWFHGPRPVATPTDWPGRELRLPSATPADVPWRKHM